MVTAGLVASMSCVGPSSFLRVSVARMKDMFVLSRPSYIGHSVPHPQPDALLTQVAHLGVHGTGDFQRFCALRGALQAIHAATSGPDERGAGEQRLLLAHAALRRLVEVGVIAVDEGAEPAVDLHALGGRAAQQELLEVDAVDRATRL